LGTSCIFTHAEHQFSYSFIMLHHYH
jgi:hypothetical protein